jgi:polar amino acid transport system substrate-binding protein
MKKIIFIVLLVSLLISVVSCSQATGKLKSIKSSQRLVVLTDPNFPPFEFIGFNQNIVGVDIEIAQAIADELGVRLSVVSSDFDAIIPAIRSGRGDIAISGFTIKPERQRVVDFSIPYIESVQYLILRENENRITTMESLAGKNVGVVRGYSGQLWIDDEMAEDGVLYDKDVNVIEYSNATDATLDLRAMRVDAVIMDEFVAKDIVSMGAGLQTIPLKFNDGTLAAEEYGIVVAKGNQDLLAIINVVIERLIAEGKIAEWVVFHSR